MIYRNKSRVESIHSWDWKDEPDWAEINNCVQLIKERGFEPAFFSIDTDSDEYAVMIAPKDTASDIAQIMYDYRDVFWPDEG